MINIQPNKPVSDSHIYKRLQIITNDVIYKEATANNTTYTVTALE